MELRIGMAQTGQVIEVELPDDTDRAELRARIDQALSSVGDDDSQAVLWIEDRRGKETGIPVSRIGFVELGAGDDERRIGFG